MKFNSDQLLLLSQQFKENPAGRVHPLRCYLTSQLKGQRRLRNALRESEREREPGTEATGGVRACPSANVEWHTCVCRAHWCAGVCVCVCVCETVSHSYHFARITTLFLISCMLYRAAA